MRKPRRSKPRRRTLGTPAPIDRAAFFDRMGARAGGPPKFYKYDRQEHEKRAIDLAQSATKHARQASDCDGRSLSRLLDAARDVGKARTHLASLGTGRGGVGRRQGRLWGVVGKAEKFVDKRADNFGRMCKLTR